MPLTATERAVWKLSQRPGMTDAAIGREIGISREWACKTRKRVERIIQACNGFAFEQAHNASPLNIEKLVDRIDEIRAAQPAVRLAVA